MTDHSSQRADPFAIDSEPDLANFKPNPVQRTPAAVRATIRQISDDNNFPSRSATPLKLAKHRRRITGRNQQLNLKVKRETIEQLVAVADSNGWVLGEALEHALAALKECHEKNGGQS